MEREVDNQVAAPAETRTPNLHRAKNRSSKSADGRVATVLATRPKRQIVSNEKTKEPTWLRPVFSWKGVTLRIPGHGKKAGGVAASSAWLAA